MAAPEKIYVYIPSDDTVGIASTRKGFPNQFVNTEYVRKDDFIEKACEWLKNHNDYIDVKDGNITYFDMEKCVIDFKRYMKGGEE